MLPGNRPVFQTSQPLQRPNQFQQQQQHAIQQQQFSQQQLNQNQLNQPTHLTPSSAQKQHVAQLYNAMTRDGDALKQLTPHDHVNLQALNLRYLQQIASKRQFQLNHQQNVQQQQQHHQQHDHSSAAAHQQQQAYAQLMQQHQQQQQHLQQRPMLQAKF